MRRHPERSRDSYNTRKDLGLSPRARFCTVITQDLWVGGIFYEGVVLKLYRKSTPDLLERVTEIALKTDRATDVRKLAIGREYPAIDVWGGGVEVKQHGIDDGIVCKD